MAENETNMTPQETEAQAFHDNQPDLRFAINDVTWKLLLDQGSLVDHMNACVALTERVDHEIPTEREKMELFNTLLDIKRTILIMDLYVVHNGNNNVPPVEDGEADETPSEDNVTEQ